MQSTTQKQPLNNEQHLSGYDLTTLLIRGGLSKLGLNSNAKLVLTYLATCYNEKNGSVYPRVKTMAEALDISERGIIRALAELTEKGCIIRSKRGKNKNVYVITNKVLSSNDTTKGQDDISSNDTVSLPCKHEVKQEEIKEQQVKKVVSLKKSFNNEVPEQIKQYLTLKGITNPAGYWRSAVNGGYADDLVSKATAELERQERIRRNAEELRQEKLREVQEREELKAELSKPLTEQWTRELAISHIYTLRHIIRKGHANGLAKDLAKAFNLDINEIIKS